MQAGIENEHLTIALEPEAASLYCQYLPVEKFISAGQVRFSDVKPGTTYMIVDLGGKIQSLLSEKCDFFYSHAYNRDCVIMITIVTLINLIKVM